MDWLGTQSTISKGTDKVEVPVPGRACRVGVVDSERDNNRALKTGEIGVLLRRDHEVLYRAVDRRTSCAYISKRSGRRSRRDV